MALFIWAVPEWIKPPINAPPAIIAAFWTGGMLDLATSFPTAVATPTIAAPDPIWLPTLLIPFDNSTAASFPIDILVLRLTLFSLFLTQKITSI